MRYSPDDVAVMRSEMAALIRERAELARRLEIVERDMRAVLGETAEANFQRARLSDEHGRAFAMRVAELAVLEALTGPERVALADAVADAEQPLRDELAERRSAVSKESDQPTRTTVRFSRLRS